MTTHGGTEARRLLLEEPLTERIIGCAIEVHRHLGPGLMESTYEEAMCVELRDAGLAFWRQIGVPIVYKGTQIGEYRLTWSSTRVSSSKSRALNA